MSVPELPGSLRSLIELGLSLARRTTSGRIGFARYARVVDDASVPEAIRAQVRSELDGAWDAVVEPFGNEKNVIAVTPTAQVHVSGGRAIKLARPGIAQQIRSELALLDTMAAPLRVVFNSLDVRGVMKEVRETVMDELDLEHEAEQQQRVRRALRRLDGVVVPEAFVDDCAPDRMESELLEGAETPEDPARAAELLIAAHLTAWRQAGLVLTDARPSHLIFLPGGGLGLLGTGLARPHDRDRADAFIASFVALGDDDPAAFVAAVAELEILDASDAATAHGLLRDVLGDLATGEATLDARALHDLGIRAFERLGDFLKLAAGVTPDPRDVHAARMLGQLTATLASFEVTANWSELVERAAAAG